MTNLRCDYFETPGDGEHPGLPDGAVIGCGSDADPGPLFFFVPVADGCAVRVPVCREHCEALRRQFAAEEVT